MSQYVQPSRRAYRQLGDDLDYYTKGGVDGADEAKVMLEELRQKIENLPGWVVLAMSYPERMTTDQEDETAATPLVDVVRAVHRLGARITGMKHVFPRDTQPWAYGERMEASLQEIEDNMDRKGLITAIRNSFGQTHQDA